MTVVSQVCMVCGRPEKSKSAMDQHIKDRHGNKWAPAQMTRAKDQGEFRPCAANTRWGQEFR